MLRKTIYLSTLSLLVTTSCFAGLYLGAAVGPEGAAFSQKAHIVRPGTFDAVDKTHFSGTGVFGSIFAGYELGYNQFNLAIEADANLSSVEYKQLNDEFVHQAFAKTTFRVQHSEGISFLPGLVLSPTTLLYLRVGYENGRFVAREADPSIGDIRKDLDGIRYGIGMRHAFSPTWAVRIDYSQINYEGARTHTFDPIGGVTKDTRIAPTTAQLALGLVYNFDHPPVFVK